MRHAQEAAARWVPGAMLLVTSLLFSQPAKAADCIFLGGGRSEFARDPENLSRVFAAVREVGIRRSDDGGITWSVATGDLPTVWVGRVTVASDHVALVVTDDGIYRSIDLGTHWGRVPLLGGSSPTEFADVVADPRQPSTVYASESPGFQVSHDAGASWTVKPIPGPQVGGGIITIDPGSGAIYTRGQKSVDGGETWTPLGLVETSLIVFTTPVGILPDPAFPSIVFDLENTYNRFFHQDMGAYLLRSDDGGLTFRVISFLPDSSRVPLTHGNRLAWGAFGDLYASTERGVFVSRDRGLTWELAAGGRPAVALSPGPDGVMLFGDGLFACRIQERGPCLFYDALCFQGGRFQATVLWQSGETGGGGHEIPLTTDAGLFWFFSPNNIEIAIKVVDGRALNGRFWVFVAGLTDVEYSLVIKDNQTGAIWTHHNPQGTLASFADTAAF